MSVEIQLFKGKLKPNKVHLKRNNMKINKDFSFQQDINSLGTQTNKELASSTTDSPENNHLKNKGKKDGQSSSASPVKSQSEIPNLRLNTNSTNESLEFQQSYMDMSQ